MIKILGSNRGIVVNGSLSMVNGKWYVDDKEVSLEELASSVDKEESNVIININLATGSVIENLDVDSCKNITINGSCKRIKNSGGNIIVTGDVDGDVHANMGDIECGNVKGGVRSNMGNVTYRR